MNQALKARMQAHWQDWSVRFSALSRRERLLVAGVCVVGLFYLGLMLWIEPMWARTRSYERQSQLRATELAGLQTQVVLLGQQVSADPNGPLKAELASLQTQIEALEARMARFDASLVPPERTVALLKGLIRKTPGVRLTGFTTLPAAGLLASRQPVAGQARNGQPQPVELAADVYQHGFELKVRGNYLALLAYLHALEAQPERLLWQRATLQVAAYPESELTLTVYTLSMDKHWLEL